MMNDIIRSSGGIVPVAKVPVTVRVGVAGDIPFIDRLQKMHAKQVGWMPTQQLEGKIKLGHVLVAETVGGVGDPATGTASATPSTGERVGYCIGNDQYFKRDDVGIIYQMNVLPGKQRLLVGAMLLKEMFERSAWGCKLYCCWCAQDIAANKFWEAMGFVPLAFRAGSEKKGRVHIFWQKRIRAGDVTTPWWFPAKTNSGSIREDRIVLPIPPGTHWSDAKPMILNSVGGVGEPALLGTASATPSTGARRAKKEKVKDKPLVGPRNGLRFDVPKVGQITAIQKPVREKKAKAKADPKLVNAARELRDRWLEKVNEEPGLIESSGKYDVVRMIGQDEGKKVLALTDDRPLAA
jgi:hypothetical protein